MKMENKHITKKEKIIIIQNCIKNIELVKNLLDKDWLYREFAKINSYKPPKNLRKMSYVGYVKEKFHPLAYLLSLVNNQLMDFFKSGKFIATEQILKLSCLGRNLSILIDNKIKGLECKIEDLTSSDFNLYSKTFFEIEIAAAYARKNFELEFITPKEYKTPDIIINFDKGIEIECTKKDITRQEILNFQYWKRIVQESSVLMDSFKLNYAIFLESKDNPTNSALEFILSEIYKLMKIKKFGEFEYLDKGIIINLYLLSDLDKIMKSKFIHVIADKNYDFFQQVELKIKKNRSMDYKNLRIFGFKSKSIPDRIISVINSIKVKKKQLSGKLPGLIYVNLTAFNKNMVEEDFKRLDHSVRQLLHNNTTISGIVITSEYLEKFMQGCMYRHRAKVIINENAKNPIPTGFEIVGIAQDLYRQQE